MHKAYSTGVVFARRHHYVAGIKEIVPSTTFDVRKTIAEIFNTNVFLFTDRVGLLENKLNIVAGHLVKILFSQNLLSLDNDGKNTK